MKEEKDGEEGEGLEVGARKKKRDVKVDSAASVSGTVAETPALAPSRRIERTWCGNGRKDAVREGSSTAACPTPTAELAPKKEVTG